MPVVNITDSELELLESSNVENIVAVSKRLKNSKDIYIPKNRLDEVISERDNLRQNVNQLTTEKIDAVNKLTEVEKNSVEKITALNEQVEKAKPLIESLENSRQDKIKLLKEKLGDNYLPEYDSFTVSSLDKLLSVSSKHTKVDTKVSSPTTSEPLKPFSEMTKEEREKVIKQAKSGTLRIPISTST